jgi:hypothetical protein
MISGSILKGIVPRVCLIRVGFEDKKKKKIEYI